MPTDDPRPTDQPDGAADRPAPPMPVFQPLAADDPREVGGYRLFARLGSGGMGRVYLSYTPGGRPVALKVVRPEFAEDPEFRRRFRQEVTNAQRIHGLYTAQVIDAGPDAASPWLVTAYVPGPSLQQVVREYGALPVRTVLLLMGGIAEALQAIHSVEVVHRDLKPANVLVAGDGPRVIDFGIARAADATALTGTGYRIGSPAFMAPEQALGKSASPATDVFALGALAAYVAGGSSPFGEGPDTAVLYRVVHEQPELGGCPAQLRDLLLRCLAKSPEDRPRPAEIIQLCREHPAVGGSLRFTDDWLPSPVNTEITRRSDLPKTPPTPVGVPAPPLAPPKPAFAPVPAQPSAPPATAPAAASEPQPAPAPTPTPTPTVPDPGPVRSQPTVQLRQEPPEPPEETAPQTVAVTPRPEPEKRRRGVPVKVLLAVAVVVAAGGVAAGVVLSQDLGKKKSTSTVAVGASTPATDGASVPADQTTPESTPTASDTASPDGSGGDESGSPSASPTTRPPAQYTLVYQGRTLSVPDTNYYFDLKAGKVVADSGEWTLSTDSSDSGNFYLPSDTDAYITRDTKLTPEQCSAEIDQQPLNTVTFDDVPAGRLFCLRSRKTGDVAVIKVVKTDPNKYGAEITIDYYRNDG